MTERRYCGRTRRCTRTDIETVCEAPLMRGDRIESADLDGDIWDDTDEYEWGCRVCGLFPDDPEKDSRSVRYYAEMDRWCGGRYWLSSNPADVKLANMWEGDIVPAQNQWTHPTRPNAVSHAHFSELTNEARGEIERRERPRAVVEEGLDDWHCSSREVLEELGIVIDARIENNTSIRTLIDHGWLIWSTTKATRPRPSAEWEQTIRDLHSASRSQRGRGPRRCVNDQHWVSAVGVMLNRVGFALVRVRQTSAFVAMKMPDAVAAYRQFIRGVLERDVQ